MPRFFLHIDNGEERIEDEEGSLLPDLTAARNEALTSARQLWAAAILQQRDLGSRRFIISDADNTEIDIVEMDEGLPVALIVRLQGKSLSSPV